MNEAVNGGARLRLVAELQCLDVHSPKGARNNLVRLLPLEPIGCPLELTGLSGEQLRQLAPLYGERVVLQIEVAAS